MDPKNQPGAPDEPGSATAPQPVVETPAAAAETPPAAAVEGAHTENPSFLNKGPGAEPKPEAKAEEPPKEGEEPKPAEEAKPGEEPKPEVKPGEEPKPAEEAKPGEEPKPVEAPKPEPLTYEAPTLPEGVTLNDERIAAFDGIIGQHQLPPEARQELVDLYVQERRGWEQDALKAQHRAFADTRKGWYEQIAGDEELGGAAIETTKAAAINMINEFVAPAYRDAFEQMLVVTGAGDHPEMVRFLKNVSKKFGAPAVPVVPAGPAPDRGGGAGKGRRMRDMYDNPTSPKSA